MTGKSNVAGPSAAGATVAVSPSPIGFGNVVVGTTNTQTVSVSNGATSDFTIKGVKISGAGFGISGLSTPLTVGAGQDATFTVAFRPTSPGGASGHILLSSGNNPFGSLTVSLTGNGVTATTQLSANMSSLSFGNVTVGTPSSQSVVLTNTGNSDVTIATVSASGTGFGASGGSNAILASGQSVSVAVSFNPQAAGGAAGTLSVSSNASNPLLQIPLSGKGIAQPTQQQPVQHSVALNWDPSASAVIGYFVYRGTITGGPYSKLNSSVDASSGYTDSSVSSGQTYFYVVTSVDSSNIESGYSNQVSATIPSP